MRLASVRPLLAAIVLLLPFVALYQHQAKTGAPATQQVAGALNGQAQVMPAASAAWQTVTRDNLHVGDTIHAVNNVRLLFSEGTSVDMAPASEIVIKSMNSATGALTLAHQAGRLSVDTNNPLFRLNGPALALTVERARFRVDLSEAGDTYVMSEQGLVYSTSNGEVVSVAAGESLRTGVGQRANLQASTPIALPPPPPPMPRTPTPTITPVPPTPPPQRIHIVARGDTLSEIAARYGVSQEAITKANPLENPNFLYVGQKLIIPQPK